MQNTNRPGTVSNKIRTRNNSYSLGLKKNHTPTQFKIIHQSKNLPKK